MHKVHSKPPAVLPAVVYQQPMAWLCIASAQLATHHRWLAPLLHQQRRQDQQVRPTSQALVHCCLPGPPPPLPGAWDLCRTTSALPSTTLPDRALEAVSALPGLSMCTKPYPLQHSAYNWVELIL